MVRGMRWTLIWGLAVAIMVAATARAFGQTIKEEPKTQQKPGIYFESVERGKTELVALDAAMGNVDAGAGGFGMFKKPKITTTIGGDRAARRLLTMQPSFLFVFGRLTPQQMMDDPGGTTAMMPPTATNPKQFALAILDVANGNRTIESGKTRLVKLVSESVSGMVFRVHPEAPLAAGEYAFYFAPSGSAAAGVTWDFGVEPPKTDAAK